MAIENFGLPVKQQIYFIAVNFPAQYTLRMWLPLTLINLHLTILFTEPKTVSNLFSCTVKIQSQWGMNLLCGNSSRHTHSAQLPLMEVKVLTKWEITAKLFIVKSLSLDFRYKDRIDDRRHSMFPRDMLVKEIFEQDTSTGTEDLEETAWTIRSLYHHK